MYPNLAIISQTITDALSLTNPGYVVIAEKLQNKPYPKIFAIRESTAVGELKRGISQRIAVNLN